MNDTTHRAVGFPKEQADAMRAALKPSVADGLTPMVSEATAHVVRAASVERQQFLANRATCIGGSDVAAILGVSEYKSAHDVWLTKQPGYVDTFEPTDKMQWGTRLEPLIADQYAANHGVTVVKGGFIRSVDHECLGGHADYLEIVVGILPEHQIGMYEGRLVRKNLTPAMPNKILEIKCVESYIYKQWKQELPLDYWCQGQHYMHLTGAKQCVFVLLVNGWRTEEIPVAAYENWATEYVPKLVAWWDTHVIGNVEPERIEPTKADPNATAIEMDTTDIERFHDLVETKQLISELEGREAALKTMFQERLGAASTMTWGSKTAITWNEQTRNALDQKALKAAHPELVTQFTKASTTRTFLVKNIEL